MILRGIKDLQELCDLYDIPPKALSPYEILYAYYDEIGYEGFSELILTKDNKFYYVSACHCSCHGLEGMFEPQETSIEELKKIVKDDPFGSDESKEFRVFLEKLKGPKRLEFEFDFCRAVYDSFYRGKKGLDTNDQFMEYFVAKWAPKDMLENTEKHDTSKECDE